MNNLLSYSFIILLALLTPVQAQAPKWGFLGDNESLKATFSDSKKVVLVCVYETELRDVKPPFAKVVYHATVVETHKGDLIVGNQIQVSFKTDSLPKNEEKRIQFVEKANAKNKGALKFAFLNDGEDGVYSCEFLHTPKYSKEMQNFLRNLSHSPNNN